MSRPRLDRLARSGLALALIGSTALWPDGPAGAATGVGLAWRPCPASVGSSLGVVSTGEHLQCATLKVPLDYARPAGAQIAIALDRTPATGTQIGTLLINPGGPGASGVDDLASEDGPTADGGLDATLKEHFDLVEFDPRGVDRSQGVSCLNGTALDNYLDADPAPTTPGGLSALVEADRSFLAACEAHSGRVLTSIGTLNAARDMDRIRQALGQSTLNYLGFSYGTYLGAVYAQLYPTHIRAMVLDGAKDPDVGQLDADVDQAVSLENELDDFFAWCPRQAASVCPWRPVGRPEAALARLLAGIGRHPLATLGQGGRTLGPGLALTGVVTPLYSPAGWSLLGKALAGAEEGNGTGLLVLADVLNGRQPNGSYDDLVAANTAVNCDDSPRPASLTAVEAAASAAANLAPIFGRANVDSSLICALWPSSGPAPHPITAAGSPPIVVVGSTGDPATPYPWAVALAKQLSRGVLVTRVGDGHTGYGFSACVRAAVDAYLVSLTPPAAGTRCPTP